MAMAIIGGFIGAVIFIAALVAAYIVYQGGAQ